MNLYNSRYPYKGISKKAYAIVVVVLTCFEIIAPRLLQISTVFSYQQPLQP
jgi:hypothetical protein